MSTCSECLHALDKVGSGSSHSLQLSGRFHPWLIALSMSAWPSSGPWGTWTSLGGSFGKGFPSWYDSFVGSSSHCGLSASHLAALKGTRQMPVPTLRVEEQKDSWDSCLCWQCWGILPWGFLLSEDTASCLIGDFLLFADRGIWLTLILQASV